MTSIAHCLLYILIGVVKAQHSQSISCIICLETSPIQDIEIHEGLENNACSFPAWSDYKDRGRFSMDELRLGFVNRRVIENPLEVLLPTNKVCEGKLELGGDREVWTEGYQFCKTRDRSERYFTLERACYKRCQYIYDKKDPIFCGEGFEICKEPLIKSIVDNRSHYILCFIIFLLSSIIIILLVKLKRIREVQITCWYVNPIYLQQKDKCI